MFCHVRDTTRLISFPRIHNNSLWPIFHKNSRHDIYYGNDFYDYYYNNGISKKSDFLNLYDSGLLDFKFEERFKKNIEISRNKEENTDIKVVDYIINNIKDYQLFLTQDHATSRVFYHLANEVCELLDLSFNEGFSIDSIDINHTRSPDSVYNSTTMMYPDSDYSINHFGFKWCKNTNTSFYRNILCNYLDSRY